MLLSRAHYEPSKPLQSKSNHTELAEGNHNSVDNRVF
jgi:hypothetical protein